MNVEQFVMAYQVEQDRLRAMLPEGYASLRPVLRINTEIRDEKTVYAELNTPVAHDGKRGWLNIAHWESPESELLFRRDGRKTAIEAPFLVLTYEGAGIEGGCPAESDNDGCFFLHDAQKFRPTEVIKSNKEFCDCEFAWRFHIGDASGRSAGKTLPAFMEGSRAEYDRQELTAENAALIPCRRVLGAYIVRFER